MNINESKAFRKNISLKSISDNVLTVRSINNYLINDTKKDIKKIKISFYDNDQALQDLYIKNMRKVISGRWGDKLFSNEFLDKERTFKAGRDLLYDIYNNIGGDTDDAELLFANTIKEHYPLEEPYILSIITAELSVVDDVLGNIYDNFVFITLNQLKTSNPEVKYNKGEVELGIDVVPNIKLTTPEWGVLYPNINDMDIDVNSVMFYLKSYKNIYAVNKIGDILDIDLRIKDLEKEMFFNVVKDILQSDYIDSNTMKSIYYILNKSYLQNSLSENDKRIYRQDIIDILKKAGIKDAYISQERYDELLGSKDKNFLVDYLAETKPLDFKMKNSGLNFKLDPMSIDNLKVINEDGKKKIEFFIDNEDGLFINGLEIK